MALLCGCNSPSRIKIGESSVVPPKDNGTPATLSTGEIKTTIPVPEQTKVTVVETESAPATQSTPFLPAQKVTTLDFKKPTEIVTVQATQSASTGAIDTETRKHALDIAERRWLLFAAIGCGLAGIVLKSFMPAWPGLSNGLLLGAGVAGVAWKVAALPWFVWLIPIGIMGIKALGYIRGERDVLEVKK